MHHKNNTPLEVISVVVVVVVVFMFTLRNFSQYCCFVPLYL